MAPVFFHGSDAARVYTSLLCNRAMGAEAQLVEASGRSKLAEDVNLQLRMDSTRNGVEEEYMREDPCTIFSAFHDSGIGTSVPTQTQSHASFVSHVLPERRAIASASLARRGLVPANLFNAI